MSSEEHENQVSAILILEILGRPPEHLKKTLEELIAGMGKEKGVEVKGKKINEPVELKEKKEFYTTFAEIEVEVKSISHLAMLMFKYMPAHIEIISPENLKLSNNSIGELFNEVIRRLHGYDEIARIIQAERKILEQKLRALMQEKEKASKSAKPSNTKEDKK